MDIKTINSQSKLRVELAENETVFLLLYKSESESSMCALERLTNQEENDGDILCLKADVAKTTDIHQEYNITSVPTLLKFDKGKITNVVKGCMSEDYYKSLMLGEYKKYGSEEEEKKIKKVTVYGTTSCSWCTRIRNYFDEKGVKYQYVDVASDSNRMEEMKRKSGQMGVPQTEIDGHMVVGFDKVKINRLLNLN